VADNRDLVKRQFGAHAERYVASVHHATGESLDRLLALVSPRPEWRALDVATGGGHTALALAPLVREVIATDITPKMLEAAEKFLLSRGVTNARFREADATALPFGAAEFDLVTCRIAPHHFSDCARFVREMARVLKPGGIAVVIDNVVPEDREAAEFINRFESVRDPSHNRAYSEREWAEFYRAAGFEILALERFRKARDFGVWTSMMSVSEETNAALREMLRVAPAAAREALAPEERDGALVFHLDEVLISGSAPAG
jgi:ubiquinone/menaquinone biosynthesis C-methylase UbiE